MDQETPDEQKRDISFDKIKEIAKKLKKLKKNWAIELGKAIAEGENLPKFNETNVYNITNNQVKHQEFRRIFVLYATKMMDALSEKQDTAFDLAEKLK